MSTERITEQEWIDDEIVERAMPVEVLLEFFHKNMSAVELRDSDYEIAAFHDLCYRDGKGKNERIMGVCWNKLNTNF